MTHRCIKAASQFSRRLHLHWESPALYSCSWVRYLPLWVSVSNGMKLYPILPMVYPLTPSNRVQIFLSTAFIIALGVTVSIRQPQIPAQKLIYPYLSSGSNRLRDESTSQQRCARRVSDCSLFHRYHIWRTGTRLPRNHRGARLSSGRILHGHVVPDVEIWRAGYEQWA